MLVIISSNKLVIIDRIINMIITNITSTTTTYQSFTSYNTNANNSKTKDVIIVSVMIPVAMITRRKVIFIMRLSRIKNNIDGDV